MTESDFWEYFEEESRLDDLVEDSLALLTDELNRLREVARNLVRYDNECLDRKPRTLRLDQIIDQARTVLEKHGGVR